MVFTLLTKLRNNDTILTYIDFIVYYNFLY